MTYAEKGKLRLQNITTFDIKKFEEKDKNPFSVCPVSEGLGLEYCYDGKNYIVISFIYYDLHEEDSALKAVGQRILELDKDEWEDFKELAKVGCSLVRLANTNN